jgi:hypothetical protein
MQFRAIGLSAVPRRDANKWLRLVALGHGKSPFVLPVCFREAIWLSGANYLAGL